MTGIIAALKEELDILEQMMDGTQTIVAGGTVFKKGFIKGCKTVIALSGVGKVNAAMTTAVMLTSFDVDELISIGMAGGVERSLRRGDIVVADRLVQYDFDTTAFGNGIGEMDGREGPYFYCSSRLTAALYEAAGTLATAKIGVIATGDRFVADTDFADYLSRTFDAYCVEMESCAAAQVAERFKVDFAACRVVSDGGGDEAAGDFNAFKAAEKSAEAVALYLAAKAASKASGGKAEENRN